MLHCDKSPDKLPQRPLRKRSLTPDRHGSDLASLAVVAPVGMGAGISGYPIRASLLKRNCRPGLAIIITLEAAQLELQKIESMTTSIPLERDRDLKRRWYRLLQRAVPSDRLSLSCLICAEGHPPERAARRARPAATSRQCKALRPRPGSARSPRHAA
jgi:hypothetical protein